MNIIIPSSYGARGREIYILAAGMHTFMQKVNFTVIKVLKIEVSTKIYSTQTGSTFIPHK